MKPGDRLAHYEVIDPIGAGGMGEVHRARDTRLDREVALKILPDDFAADPERLARFRREAKLLAALNHTNIASIFGIEEDAGKIFLAMELAPGETLAGTIERGPVPFGEVLAIAAQMAGGLEAAHEKGIVHRDLKPANVKLGPEGQVKILDFGLARAYAGEEVAEGDPGASPTMTAAMTRDGMILGTAAYMSPEQARGREVDSRTDVWAFGVIVYELLTGQRLFAGETISDTLALVLRGEPDWDALPPDLPPSLRRLLKRCLQKDRRQRLHHIADARIVVEEIIAEGSSAHAALDMALVATIKSRGARLPWAAVAVLAVVAAFFAWRSFDRPAPVAPRPIHGQIGLPPEQWLSAARKAIAVSPTGDAFACATISLAGEMMFLREFGDDTFRPIAGTEGSESPFFSPDGRWIAFLQDGTLRKVKREGGQPVDICRADWGAGVWLADGRIIFTRSYAAGLEAVSADGGEPVVLTRPAIDQGELGHWWPDVLPGGEWIIYTSWSTPAANSRVMAYSLVTGETRELVRGAAYGRWSPTGHLVYLRSEQLMAVPFDPQRLELTGSPVPVLEDVYVNPTDGFAVLEFSDDGTLVYAAASVMNVPNRLVWVDRAGEATPLDLPERRYSGPRLAPDGSRVAVTVQDGLNQDIWLCDLRRGTASRFTFGPAADFGPVWSADSRTIFYSSEEPQFVLYARPADGSAEPRRLLKLEIDATPTSVSPDGRWLVHTRSTVENDSEIWALELGGEHEERCLVTSPYAEMKGVVSPSGRWLAYQSNESGRVETYVIAFPDGGGRVQASVDGGGDPFWSADGRELFYRTGADVMSVAVGPEPTTNGGIDLDRPEKVFSRAFDVTWYATPYNSAGDGERFLMVDVSGSLKARTLQIVTNWFAELERLVAEGQ